MTKEQIINIIKSGGIFGRKYFLGYDSSKNHFYLESGSIVRAISDDDAKSFAEDADLSFIEEREEFLCEDF